MKNVLFVSGIGGDSRRYRCLHHQEQLALHGIASTLRTADELALYVDITTHDLLILHRTPLTPLIADLIEVAHLRGLPVIFETDDLIFEPELHGSIGFLDTLSPEEAHQFRQELYGQAKALALSDFVLTTTDYLAAAAARHGKSVFIQRNACSVEMVRSAEVAYQLRNGPNGAELSVSSSGQSVDRQEILIGYFSGTGSHNRDFATITPALLAVLHRYPQVWLHISGYLELDARFQAYRERIRRAPFVAWQELPNLMAQVDINLAPLELDNPFCQAKSEIKYSEAALVGVPTIASPTDAFVHAITHDENGLLADDSEAWQAALFRLVEEPVTRRRLGEAARRHVYAQYTAVTRSQELIATLGQMEATYQPSGAEAARIPETLARAMMRQIEQLTAEQVQQANQLRSLRQTIAGWQARPDSVSEQFWRRSYEQAEVAHIEALRSILARLRKE